MFGNISVIHDKRFTLMLTFLISFHFSPTLMTINLGKTHVHVTVGFWKVFPFTFLVGLPAEVGETRLESNLSVGLGQRCFFALRASWVRPSRFLNDEAP